MHSRIPAQLNPLLQDFVTQLHIALPGLVNGLYLHGSVALNGFDEFSNDIDFVAFFTRLPNAEELEKLGALHAALATVYPQWTFDGCYLQWHELGALGDDLGAGATIRDNHFEAHNQVDVNSVTWWLLKQRGIALIGPDPESLPLTVDWQRLVRWMRGNLNDYWATYIHKPQHIIWLLHDYGIQWAVLGVLRQYYTLTAHDITSKLDAGEYALTHLPAQWHNIIREAIRIRTRQPNTLYRTKLTRAADAYNFLRYIIQYCNSLPI